MARISKNRSGGFTLVELMVVVAIIGVLASVAIPSFLNYQLTSKRAEAFANLSALSKAQKAYFAEFNDFVGVASEPAGALSLDPTTIKRDVTSVTTAFADVGWTPDGDVFFDYDTVTPTEEPSRCGCTEACFTSAAYGDLDGNGLMSVMLYAHPTPSGDFCETWLLTQSPPINDGTRAFDQVVRAIGGDDY